MFKYTFIFKLLCLFFLLLVSLYPFFCCFFFVNVYRTNNFKVQSLFWKPLYLFLLLIQHFFSLKRHWKITPFLKKKTNSFFFKTIPCTNSFFFWTISCINSLFLCWTIFLFVGIFSVFFLLSKQKKIPRSIPFLYLFIFFVGIFVSLLLFKSFFFHCFFFKAFLLFVVVFLISLVCSFFFCFFVCCYIFFVFF